MEINGVAIVIFILFLFSLPHLFSVIAERVPRKKSKSSFRQFPTFPVDEE